LTEGTDGGAERREYRRPLSLLTIAISEGSGITEDIEVPHGLDNWDYAMIDKRSSQAYEAVPAVEKTPRIVEVWHHGS
jgi:hypothetical protein